VDNIGAKSGGTHASWAYGLRTIIVEFDMMRLRKGDRERSNVIALGLGRKMRREQRIPAASKYEVYAFIHIQVLCNSI
jgi:hypothetical protein